MDSNTVLPVSNFSIRGETPQQDKIKKNKQLLLKILAVVAGFVLVFGIGYAVKYSAYKVKNLDSPLVKKLQGVDIVPEEVRKVPNPITGELYPENAIPPWITNRPLGVMVNNHPDARPQSALGSADLVYEMVAEGGITRFLAFYLTNTPEKIGPVRSIREYYLMIVKELGDAMIMHIGYSPQALAAIDSWPARSLFRGGATFWRDTSRDVATEHTAYVNGVDLRKLGDSLGWEGTRTLTSWKFKNDTPTPTNGRNITIDFWYKGDFSAIWKYDPQTNTYLRFMGYDETDQPMVHVDALDGKQLYTNNLIVQFATESSVAGDDKGRLEYQLIGSGKAIVFIDGKATDATWSKAERDARTRFYDLNGKEVEFNRGKFWIEIVPDRNIDQVVYN